MWTDHQTKLNLGSTALSYSPFLAAHFRKKKITVLNFKILKCFSLQYSLLIWADI